MKISLNKKLIGRLWNGWLVFGAIAITGMSMRYFSGATVDLLRLKSPELLGSILYRAFFYLHIVGGSIALLTGAFLFLKSLRERNLNLHRWLGKIYTYGVLLGGVCGLVVGYFAYGGWVSSVGFISANIGWIATTMIAVKAAQRKNIPKHQYWIEMSYALTFAAVTFRLWLLLFPVLGLSFLTGYRIAAWMPFLLNLGLLWGFRVYRARKLSYSKDLLTFNTV